MMDADFGGAGKSFWDVLMLRHNAAHVGAETRLLPLCSTRGVGVISFNALCYGRLLRLVGKDFQKGQGGAPASSLQADLALPTAGECYRYSLAQSAVAASLSAPRSTRELAENLQVLSALDEPLTPEAVVRLRRHGATVRDENHRFGALLRKGHEGAPEVLAGLKLAENAPDAAAPRQSEFPLERQWRADGDASCLSWSKRSDNI